MMTFSQMQMIVEGMLESQQQSSERQQQFEEKMEQEMNLFLARQLQLQESDLRLQSKLEQLSERQEQFSQQHEQLSQQQEKFSQQHEQLSERQEQLRQQQEKFSQQQELLRQRDEQFHEKVKQEINMLLAIQRELQESDLRRQSELAQASQERAEISQQIQGLTRIAEKLVINAEMGNRITDDHEQRIRRLEQE